MITLKLDIDDEIKEYNIPENWNDVTVSTYVKLLNLKTEGLNRFQQDAVVIGALCGMEDEDFYMIPEDEYYKIMKSVEFIKNEEIDMEPKDSVFIGTDEYFIKKDFDRLNQGEVISIQVITEKYEGRYDLAMVDLLPLFIRKKKENGKLETYKPSIAEERKQMLGDNISIADVYKLFFCFSDGKTSSISNIKDSLKAKQQVTKKEDSQS